MCGIAGNITKGECVNECIIKEMIDTITHRGPDESGIYCDDHVTLGHRRLSIIDLSTGQQPMACDDENLWITFNGEIYNFNEIKQELLQRGHNFKTHSDTEVILHAYEEYGDDCVNRFNGMFSFVVYDKRKQRLFGARDRFGIKPFYYYNDGESFVFASEIKAILASGVLKAEPDMSGIQDYVVFQFTLGNKTLFKNIKKLEPGYSFSLELGDFKLNLTQYWDLRFDYDTAHTEEYFVDRLKYLLNDSVRLRLISDVPVGSYLSGGLDSSVVASLASDMLGKNGALKTFTGAFAEGPEYNETHYAKVLSEYAKTQYHEMVMSSKQFRESIEDIIYYLDEPGAGPGVFPQYMVSKLASEHVKVVLGGQGGDEVFIGYARYLVAYLEECLKGAIDETADHDKYAVDLESVAPNLPLLKAYKPMLRYFMKDGMFENQADRYFRLVDRSEGMRALFCDSIFESAEYSSRDEFDKIFNKPELKSYINRMMYFDIKASLPALLHVEDRASMAASIESRLPLLDYRIAELFASIPPNMKFKGGESKALFKDAVKNIIPDEIWGRKDKMGFPVPLVEWYQGELKDYVSGILLDDRTKSRGIYNTGEIEKLMSSEVKFSRITWGLLCLELWFREFIDSGDAA